MSQRQFDDEYIHKYTGRRFVKVDTTQTGVWLRNTEAEITVEVSGAEVESEFYPVME